MLMYQQMHSSFNLSSKYLSVTPYSYELTEIFQVPVDPDSVRAKFSKQNKTLTLTVNTNYDRS